MQTKFKRHQKVILLRMPDKEYIEYAGEEIEIKEGMAGKINTILPNGKYHVAIEDKKGGIVAYAPMEEDDLGAIEE